MRKFSLSALVAAGLLVGGLSVGSASAADLGGNCCADLEERIAELEATTARKGNRKVSLTISGWVGEQVLWWDDGAAKGTYVTGLGTTLASHVTFAGQATIMPGWYAGYVLQLEMDEADPLAHPEPECERWTNLAWVLRGMGAPNVFYSYWFVKSDHLGKVSVGLQSSAGDNAAILVDGSGSLVPANWVQFDNAAFFIRGKNGALSNLTWGSLGFCNVGFGNAGDCVGTPENLVRYDSPTWLASRSVPTGVRTPTGMPMSATLASTTASSLLPSPAGLRPTVAEAIRLAGAAVRLRWHRTCINSPAAVSLVQILRKHLRRCGLLAVRHLR